MLFALRNLRASRVNLVMNDYAAGLPSPLAFIGLAEAVARKLDLEPWRARILPILHRVDVSPGRTKPEMESKSGVFRPIETMEDLTGSVEVSLLLDLPGFESKARLKEAALDLPLRIAGGALQSYDLDIKSVVADGRAFAALRRGYAMLRPEPGPRRLTSIGDEDELARIAELLFPVEKPPGFGWPAPVAVGYRLLEDPETAPKRSGVRAPAIPHVFAEPVLGIAELVSIRNKRLKDLDEAGLDDLFWSWMTRDDLLLGHQAYFATPMHHDKDIAHA